MAITNEDIDNQRKILIANMNDANDKYTHKEAWDKLQAHVLMYDVDKPRVEYPNDNPKDAIGCAKPPISCVSMAVMAEVGVAMAEGAFKYGRHNYRVAPIRCSVYIDATWRHLSLFWEGQDIDPDSELSHITKAITSLTVLRDAMIHKKWKDDRPPPTPENFWADLQTRMTNLTAKYPEPKAAYTCAEEAPKIGR